MSRSSATMSAAFRFTGLYEVGKARRVNEVIAIDDCNPFSLCYVERLIARGGGAAIAVAAQQPNTCIVGHQPSYDCYARVVRDYQRR